LFHIHALIKKVLKNSGQRTSNCP